MIKINACIVFRFHPIGTTRYHRPLFHSFVKAHNRTDSPMVGNLTIINISSNNSTNNSTNNLEESSLDKSISLNNLSSTPMPFCPEVPPYLRKS